jgi:hypothetical protein
MKRFPVNSALLRQDSEVPLFFVNEVPHLYYREYEGKHCSSYSNRRHKTLYMCPAAPSMGIFGITQGHGQNQSICKAPKSLHQPSPSISSSINGSPLNPLPTSLRHHILSPTSRSMVIFPDVHGLLCILPSHRCNEHDPYCGSTSGAKSTTTVTQSYGMIRNSLCGPTPGLSNTRRSTTTMIIQTWGYHGGYLSHGQPPCNIPHGGWDATVYYPPYGGWPVVFQRLQFMSVPFRCT